MSFNESKLKESFNMALGLDEGEFTADLKMGDITKWDSVGHLSLIFTIESDFDVKFDIETIPELNSVSIITSEIKKLQS